MQQELHEELQRASYASNLYSSVYKHSQSCVIREKMNAHNKNRNNLILQIKNLSNLKLLDLRVNPQKTNLLSTALKSTIFELYLCNTKENIMNCHWHCQNNYL